MEHTNSLHEIVLENNIPKLISYLSYLKKNNKINQYINKYNNECKTPLHLAVKNNLQDVSKILVKFGASTELALRLANSSLEGIRQSLFPFKLVIFL